MNVKLRAGLETLGLLAGSVAVGTAVNYGLTAASAAYGAPAVIEAVTCLLVGTAAFVIVGLLYDQRVARLQYKAKLNEMVRK